MLNPVDASRPRIEVAPCPCGNTNWYRIPGDVERCAGCGTPLRVTMRPELESRTEVPAPA